MTNTNTQFESKEHYLAFRKAWSNAVNSDKAKTHYEERTYTSRSSRTVEKYRIDGWVTGAHHVLYNILRNRSFHKGFTMINKLSKIAGGHMPHLGLHQAVYQLKHMKNLIMQEAECVPTKTSWFKKKVEEKPYWGTNRINEFLAPFEGTVTREMIMDIKVPEIITLYNDYGVGKKVAEKIKSGEATPRNYEELLTLINEVTK